ncbi:SDR family oxidoreductase [uncultured Alsobacter sp.]|uniref:SDR family NAD(P)-dependent oxidoreductase n=1 Tax=uncultured Alsobacter sp. TaxID=1748258 RepID=UPI0025F38AD5|nr:SDR family oxidoreductase [uncultured Alsobacter sp.]
MDLGARLKGRHVFVTGASGGLGEHFARLLAGCGAAVTIAARRVDKLEALVGELREAGAPHARAVPLDVTDEASIAAAMAAVVADGAPPLDVLVNNAGVAASEPAVDVTADIFDRVMDTNLRGPWLLSVAAARQWRDAGRPGVILNVASILGLRVGKGVGPYAVSKAGVVQMTKVLALEWARHGIRVNALCPGFVLTDINRDFFDKPAGQQIVKRIPMRRIGTAEELDGPFLLLVSDASSLMTGSIVAADGGHLVSEL